MSAFTAAELEYLASDRRLARVATVGADGMPHIAPVGWRIIEDGSAVEISGRDFAATKKFRDVARTGVAAVVIDDVLPPWQPRGVEIRGRAQALPGPPARIRIDPTRIVSWGLEGGQNARDVPVSG